MGNKQRSKERAGVDIRCSCVDNDKTPLSKEEERQEKERGAGQTSVTDAQKRRGLEKWGSEVLTVLGGSLSDCGFQGHWLCCAADPWSDGSGKMQRDCRHSDKQLHSGYRTVSPQRRLLHLQAH